MSKFFSCPACNRSLIFQGVTTQVCTHCRANIIVPAQVFNDVGLVERRSNEVLGQQSQPSPDPSEYRSRKLEMEEKSLLLTELSRLLHQDQKLQAVKVFRDMTGCSLANSLEAINGFEKGDMSLFNELTGSTRGINARKDVVYGERPNYILALAVFFLLVAATVLGVFLATGF